MIVKQFVIICERAIGRALAIGPFDHVEQAEEYAHKKYGHQVTVWRIAELQLPEESK